MVPDSSQTTWPDSIDRRSMLVERAAPACWLCKSEQEDLQRFFFWYLSERCHEPHVVSKMQRSVGFCRRHSRHLVRHGSTPRVAAIYESILQAHVDRVQGALSALARMQPVGPQDVFPHDDAGCLACEGELASRWQSLRWLQHAFAAVDRLNDARVEPQICVAHLMVTAETFTVQALRAAIAWLVAQLRRAALVVGPLTDADAIRVIELVRGVDLDACVRGPLSGADATGTCAVCDSRATALADYFGRVAPQSQPAPPAQLCRTHVWDCVVLNGYERAAEEARGASMALRASLAPLAGMRRFADGEYPAVDKTRHDTWTRTEQGESRVPSRFAGLLETWYTARNPLGQHLTRQMAMLEPAVCPACERLAAAVSASTVKIVGELEDPPSASRHPDRTSVAVCTRDLPLVLAACQGPTSKRLLLEAEHETLASLQRELATLKRDDAAAGKHGGDDSGHSACQRVAARISGTCGVAPSSLPSAASRRPTDAGIGSGGVAGDKHSGNGARGRRG
jgi:hypothetical protein